jgi:DNA-binding Lrp family transcriptional regulator
MLFLSNLAGWLYNAGMPRKRSPSVDEALLASVEAHPRDLTRTVAEQIGVSRQTVAGRVRNLVEEGYLARSGTTRPTYVRGVRREGMFRHALKGLAEDQVWSDEVAPLLRGMPANLVDIAHHGLTEMVNNAIDHSEGRHLQVMARRDAERLSLWVVDDGIGIFRKIARALALPDERLALLELSKGKFTTDPRRHTGEGVFFTSRMFDNFQIVSGDLVFDHDDVEEDDLLYDVEVPRAPHGTTVFMTVSLSSARTAKQVFDEYSSGPDDYDFAKTVVPVRLAKVGDENLVSRSQAKRLMQRVDKFRCVVLDFDGVGMIGPAFADEVFRVFANAHPHVELGVMRAVPEVQQMIRRAQIAHDNDNGQLPLI